MPDTARPTLPEARVVTRRRTRLAPVWIVPLVAAAVGVWVAATRILGAGPVITIQLATAEGLEAGKTKVHYNGVDVGSVETIRLSPDHLSVLATVQMAPETEPFLVADTTFWVVSPRISGANVSGLGTLISGAYLGMAIGASKTAQRTFVALDTPPVIAGNQPGRFFVLKTSSLGSLDAGTPIYFRRLQVGQVASYALDPDGASLSVKVFVDTPYDQYVNPNTRFWNASGVDVSLTAAGLKVQTQSLLSILVGGVAFETAADAPLLPPADENATFTLFDSREDAFRAPPRSPQTYQLLFTDSLRGLSVGAPVYFRGIEVGEVAKIDAQIDAQTLRFSAPVTITLDAQRLGIQVKDLPPDADLDALRREFLDRLVAGGVRAQLQAGNLLTGALLVSFDVYPNAPPARIDWAHDPPRLPTIPGELQALENSVASIVKKLDQVPYQAIGDDLRKTLAELDRTLASARATLDNADRLVGNADRLVGNADRLVEPSSVLGAELATTLQELSRAARSLRVLTDYLEQHPESLLRGKPGEAK
ncbi:MCE family protein [bacterium]|nr:MCE family protein [bacterium]